MVGRLGDASSSLKVLEVESGLRTLRLELGLMLEREVLEEERTLSLTSGTRSLPSAPRIKRDRSRLGETEVADEEEGDGDAVEP